MSGSRYGGNSVAREGEPDYLVLENYDFDGQHVQHHLPVARRKAPHISKKMIERAPC